MPKLYEYLGIVIFSIQTSMNQFMFMLNMIIVKVKQNFTLMKGRMKITDSTLEVDTIIEIREAQYINNYKIKVSFNDGTQRLVDFKKFLKKSNHPEINKYLDKEKFKKFNIIYGNINWNDYDMIFPVEDIYKGDIE